MKLPKKRSKKRIYAMTGGILGAGIVLAAGILAWGIYNRQRKMRILQLLLTAWIQRIKVRHRPLLIREKNIAIMNI